jgi:hypothetical protein
VSRLCLFVLPNLAPVCDMTRRVEEKLKKGTKKKAKRDRDVEIGSSCTVSGFDIFLAKL